jgi:hypothetical protein
MTSTNEQYATQASDGDGLPLPPAQDQELILDAWREALGKALHIRDTEWKEKVRVMAAEATAVIAELRASLLEIRTAMEPLIVERLAQLRQPADGKEGPRGEAGPPGRIESVRAYGVCPKC